MKKIYYLLIVGFTVLILLVSAPLVRAYDSAQLLDCISSAVKNPSTEGFSESSIQKYCECALELIVDQNKNVRESGYECAVKHFN